MIIADYLVGLEQAAELTGHIPDPWAEYLEWVLVETPNSAAGHELRRLIREVLG